MSVDISKRAKDIYIRILIKKCDTKKTNIFLLHHKCRNNSRYSARNVLRNKPFDCSRIISFLVSEFFERNHRQHQHIHLHYTRAQLTYSNCLGAYLASRVPVYGPLSRLQVTATWHLPLQLQVGITNVSTRLATYALHQKMLRGRAYVATLLHSSICRFKVRFIMLFITFFSTAGLGHSNIIFQTRQHVTLSPSKSKRRKPRLPIITNLKSRGTLRIPTVQHTLNSSLTSRMERPKSF